MTVQFKDKAIPHPHAVEDNPQRSRSESPKVTCSQVSCHIKSVEDIQTYGHAFCTSACAHRSSSPKLLRSHQAAQTGLEPWQCDQQFRVVFHYRCSGRPAIGEKRGWKLLRCFVSESCNEGQDERSRDHGGVFQLRKARYANAPPRMGGKTHDPNSARLRGHGGKGEVHGV